jgi:hypothetical protein
MQSEGTWNRSASKYQKFINISNIILIVYSAITIFISSSLMYHYQLHQLGFWDSIFVVTPWLMLGLRIWTLIVGIYGFSISQHENRPALVFMAIFLSVAFLFQAGAVRYSLELPTVVISSTPAGRGSSQVQNYGHPNHPEMAGKWDMMQSMLRCCGGSESMNIGHQDYQTASFFQRKHPNAVPDSCCKISKPGCGSGKLSDNEIDSDIYKDGCVAVLAELLKNQVALVMKIYSIVGSMMALLELVTVVLASAFVAQISRRIKRKNGLSRPAHANDNEWKYEPPQTLPKLY